jgi:hypothetical protein
VVCYCPSYDAERCRQMRGHFDGDSCDCDCHGDQDLEDEKRWRRFDDPWSREEPRFRRRADEIKNPLLN